MMPYQARAGQQVGSTTEDLAHVLERISPIEDKPNRVTESLGAIELALRLGDGQALREAILDDLGLFVREPERGNPDSAAAARAALRELHKLGWSPRSSLRGLRPARRKHGDAA